MVEGALCDSVEMHVAAGVDFICVCLSETVPTRICTARQVAFISYSSAIHVCWEILLSGVLRLLEAPLKCWVI